MNKYTILSSFPGGKVLLARDVNSNKLVTLKRGSEVNTNIEVEISLVVNHHENIAKLIDYFQVDSLHFLVYEYVEGKDLFSLFQETNFQPLIEDLVKKLFCQLVSAVDYLHQLGICHGDLKLENVVLDSSGKLTLIDFGLSSFSSADDLCCLYSGTPAYVSAEILEKKPYSGYLADVYSLGVLLYSLLYAHYPFNVMLRFGALLRHTEHPPLTFEDAFAQHPISKIAKDLIERMLMNNPSKRITMDQIKKHGWLFVNSCGCGF